MRYTPRWARGDSVDAAARASTALRSSDVSFAGTATSTVTRRSPARLLDGTPRPLTRNVRPERVPAGTLMVTGEPSTVGTLTSAPSAASEKVTGTVIVTSLSRRPNNGCGSTFATT